MKLSGDWRQTACPPVFERSDGVRIHIGGRIARLTNGQHIGPDYQQQNLCARICGSHRRGMMLWANQIAPPTDSTGGENE